MSGKLFKKTVTVIIPLLICVGSRAQTEFVFTQSFTHNSGINNAMAGVSNQLQAGFIHRSNTVGLTEQRNISTQLLYVNAPIRRINSGLGFLVQNDMIGLLRNTQIGLEYNYQVRFKSNVLAVGVNLGFIQSNIQGAKITAPDGVYINGQIQHNDQKLPDGNLASIAPDFGAGVSFSSSRYFASLSVSHIYGSGFNLSDGSLFRILPILKGHFGYNFNIKEKVSLSPTLLVQTDLKKAMLQLTLSADYLKYLRTGIGVRGYTQNTMDAVSIIQGFRWKGFILTYSYDIGVSYLRKFSSGSHEIGMNYSLPLKNKQFRGYFYSNPRFL